ncbi:hypothetical protein JNK13_07090 [bacterium]|nr:hypothetical protein [bacterium]
MDPQSQSTTSELEQIAATIHSRKLTAPVIFLLESHLPLRAVAENLILFLAPFVQPFMRKSSLDSLRNILSSPEAIQELINQLEQLEKNH